jgi:hypothetical protein
MDGWGNEGFGFATWARPCSKRVTAPELGEPNLFFPGLGFGRSFIHFEDYFHSPADMFVRTLYGREFARIYLNRTEKSKVTRALRYLGLESWLDKDSEGSGDFGGAYGVRKRASVVNQELLRWIGRDSKHPFFAFLNYFDVHDPYGGPRDYPKPAWPQQTAIDAYDNGVRYVDEHIQQLMDSLEAQAWQEILWSSSRQTTVSPSGNITWRIMGARCTGNSFTFR